MDWKLELPANCEATYNTLIYVSLFKIHPFFIVFPISLFRSSSAQPFLTARVSNFCGLSEGYEVAVHH